MMRKNTPFDADYMEKSLEKPNYKRMILIVIVFWAFIVGFGYATMRDIIKIEIYNIVNNDRMKNEFTLNIEPNSMITRNVYIINKSPFDVDIVFAKDNDNIIIDTNFNKLYKDIRIYGYMKYINPTDEIQKVIIIIKGVKS